MLFKTLHEKHVQLKKGGIQNFPVLNILSSKLFIGFYLKKELKRKRSKKLYDFKSFRTSARIANVLNL